MVAFLYFYQSAVLETRGMRGYNHRQSPDKFFILTHPLEFCRSRTFALPVFTVKAIK